MIPKHIDTEHPANASPAEATNAEIADALDGRNLFDRAMNMDFDGDCRRTKSKNRRRRAAGVDTEPVRVRDGERVRFIAHYCPAVKGTGKPPGCWRVAKTIRADHPPTPWKEVIGSDYHQVQAVGNVEIVEGEGWLLRNTSIEERSPAGDGPPNPVVVERRQQYVTDGTGDYPAGVMVVPLAEPEPDWPEAERDWLAELKEEHGPLDLDPPTAVMDYAD